MQPEKSTMTRISTFIKGITEVLQLNDTSHLAPY